ncbi:hypothetical protein GE09DRAFT_1156920 [Coniochaeta sp. 2T2.1]|nr:hypothetical protein GE09DRAFT_1156920 [Coniochaeta sp. 2T2.1]
MSLLFDLLFPSSFVILHLRPCLLPRTDPNQSALSTSLQQINPFPSSTHPSTTSHGTNQPISHHPSSILPTRLLLLLPLTTAPPPIQPIPNSRNSNSRQTGVIPDRAVDRLRRPDVLRRVPGPRGDFVAAVDRHARRTGFQQPVRVRCERGGRRGGGRGFEGVGGGYRLDEAGVCFGLGHDLLI